MNDFPAAFLIGKLSNRIRRRITEMASDLPYTGAQGKVLHYLLAQKENVYQKDIEENFSLRPSSATEVLKKMEDAGLLYRVPEEKDARLKRIILTEKALLWSWGLRIIRFPSVSFSQICMKTGMLSAEKVFNQMFCQWKKT